MLYINYTEKYMDKKIKIEKLWYKPQISPCKFILIK